MTTQSPSMASQATAELPSEERERILKAAASAMPFVNPLIWEDWQEGYTVHTEADDIVAIWQAAEAAGRASRAQSEWQSMDSAPKDGTTVYLHVSGHVYEGSWLDIPFSESRDSDGHYLGQQDAEAYWMDHEHGDTLEPTEWMPKDLPKPPATLGETK